MMDQSNVETMQLQWDNREEDTIQDRINALKADGWVLKGQASIYAKMYTTLYTLDLERRR